MPHTTLVVPALLAAFILRLLAGRALDRWLSGFRLVVVANAVAFVVATVIGSFASPEWGASALLDALVLHGSMQMIILAGDIGRWAYLG